MTELAENLILEHLRALRSEVLEVRSDITDVMTLISMLEERTGLLERGVSDLQDDVAAVYSRVNHFATQIERIERRLDLTTADGM